MVKQFSKTPVDTPKDSIKSFQNMISSKKSPNRNSPKLHKGHPRVIRKDLIRFNATPTHQISSMDNTLAKDTDDIGSKPLSLQDILNE
jgi:hypothetical protein